MLIDDLRTQEMCEKFNTQKYSESEFAIKKLQQPRELMFVVIFIHTPLSRDKDPGQTNHSWES